jgi:hypothetical protein
MSKRDVQTDITESSAGAEVTPAAVSAAPIVNLRWTPAPGNMTSERIIDEYTWTPGAVVPVAATWWQTHEVVLRTSPCETFELVAGAVAPQ